ncbi:hypothetical protein DYU11_09235 [Fibrisoma montanum]|uniref:Uncharacterized protein n=1 Tax=Fibrisoma montanum TaxID=2305895 RepID=A0A418MF87_9BACT|nr:hypothetical protein [Fibrisoma montanum]RIV25470.1 hypothetical protein DYU11_09235 [Fibrisoma montanum]
MNTPHHLIQLPKAADVVLIAGKAACIAFREALDAKLPVVVAEGNELVEVDPNGSRTVLKQLPSLRKPARRMLIIP